MPEHGTSPIEIGVHPLGDRWLVVVGGDIDVHGVLMLQGTLREVLYRSRGGVELDLSKVRFCDCSGLNALLRIRQEALDEGKTITVRAVSTAVARLLDVTHAGPLLLTADVTGTGADPSENGHLDGALPQDAVQDLFVEVVQLRRAMETRPVIDMARGVLMASFGLSAEDAWQALVEVSQRGNIKLNRLAQDLVDSIAGGPLPPTVRELLAAAVAGQAAEPTG